MEALVKKESEVMSPPDMMKTLQRISRDSEEGDGGLIFKELGAQLEEYERCWKQCEGDLQLRAGMGKEEVERALVYLRDCRPRLHERVGTGDAEEAMASEGHKEGNC